MPEYDVVRPPDDVSGRRAQAAWIAAATLTIVLAAIVIDTRRIDRQEQTAPPATPGLQAGAAASRSGKEGIMATTGTARLTITKFTGRHGRFRGRAALGRPVDAARRLG